jgi:electron transfer flavoprotein beta subunit
MLVSEKLAQGGSFLTIERSKTIAKAIEKEGGADLIVAGKLALGGDNAHVETMVAAFLKIPVLIYVSKVIEFTNERIDVERLLESGNEVVSSKLPCLITVVKDINKPRYPSLIAIRKASKVEIPVITREERG